ncbi:MAG: hypothetical protein IIW48_11210 [Clostridia bacterium]|nr:hypothetical protein [Clostridia bacterium]
MKSTVSKVVLGMAVGGVAAAIGSSMMAPSMRKQTRKNMMKAMKTVGCMMDSVQSMLK